jgi:UDP-N-acetylglucosamine:LPS N-acetylglucosamine transferase
MKKEKKIKLGLITSPGGHLFKLYQLKPWWQQYQRFWVTSPVTKKLKILNQEKVYFSRYPFNRNIINFIKNLFLAIKILNLEKPDILFSTGAGIAPPFFIIAKLMGIKLIFMETFIFIPKATLTGRIIYSIADQFLIQNKGLKKIYPKAKYWGTCL